jgi:prepilin-type N-terminal cleavage/methylation domain-containing protein
MKALRPQHGFSLIELLVVMGLAAIVAGIAMPLAGSTSAAYRLKGDAQAMANMVSLAKMRASARFSRTRIYADLTARTYRLEVWVPTNANNKNVGTWVTDGGVLQLSRGVTFGFAQLTAPPSNTQTTLGQSGTCSDADSLAGDKLADTACIVFNSRGIPIDDNGDPLGGNALYITDGSIVYGTTITATPLVRQWWANGSAQGVWTKL